MKELKDRKNKCLNKDVCKKCISSRTEWTDGAEELWEKDGFLSCPKFKDGQVLIPISFEYLPDVPYDCDYRLEHIMFIENKNV